VAEDSGSQDAIHERFRGAVMESKQLLENGQDLEAARHIARALLTLDQHAVAEEPDAAARHESFSRIIAKLLAVWGRSDLTPSVYSAIRDLATEGSEFSAETGVLAGGFVIRYYREQEQPELSVSAAFELFKRYGGYSETLFRIAAIEAFVNAVEDAQQVGGAELEHRLTDVFRGACSPTLDDCQIVARALVSRAEARFEQREFAESLPDYRRAVEFLAADGHGWDRLIAASQLSTAELELDDFDQAVIDISQALAEIPDDCWDSVEGRRLIAFQHGKLMRAQRRLHSQQGMVTAAVGLGRVLARLTGPKVRDFVMAELHWLIPDLDQEDHPALLSVFDALLPALAVSTDDGEREFGAMLAIAKAHLMAEAGADQDSGAVMDLVLGGLSQELMISAERLISAPRKLGSQRHAARASGLFIKAMVLDHQGDPAFFEVLSHLRGLDGRRDEAVRGFQELAEDRWPADR
jgi:tetratricopeptide (TPR) repeat protein